MALQVKIVNDVLDLNAYTIEETKARSEKDREAKEAEFLKLSVVDEVAKIRQEFAQLMQQFARLPNWGPAQRQAIQIDQGLQASIEQKTADAIEQLQKEMAWQQEKEAMGPRKLKAYFLDPIQSAAFSFTNFKGRVLTTFETQKWQQHDTTSDADRDVKADKARLSATSEERAQKGPLQRVTFSFLFLPQTMDTENTNSSWAKRRTSKRPVNRNE